MAKQRMIALRPEEYDDFLAMRKMLLGGGPKQTFHRPHQPADPYKDWLTCENSTGAPVEPNSVLKVGSPTGSGSLRRYPATTPDDTHPLYVVTPNREVASGAIFQGRYRGEILVRYSTGDGTPGPGETWGPENGSQELHKDQPGFIALGDATDGRAWFVQIRGSSLDEKVKADEDDAEAGYLADKIQNVAAFSSPGYSSGQDTLISIDIVDPSSDGSRMLQFYLDISDWPGFSAGDLQFLGHNPGTGLIWIDAEECPPAP